MEEKTVKYCQFCGAEMGDQAAFCKQCGKKAAAASGPAQGSYQSSTRTTNPQILNVLSSRLKTNGTIWIIIGIIQILIGICGTIVPLIVGILNIVSAIKDMNKGNEILTNPKGIVAAYEPMTMPIIVLVYNLLVGGVIGVAGSIYYFVAVRGYIMEHKNEFIDLENEAA